MGSVVPYSDVLIMGLKSLTKKNCGPEMCKEDFFAATWVIEVLAYRTRSFANYDNNRRREGAPAGFPCFHWTLREKAHFRAMYQLTWSEAELDGIRLQRYHV